MRRSRIYIALCLLIVSTMSLTAQRYSTGGVSSWLGLSAEGFMAMPIVGGNTEVKGQVGGGGQATLRYELHKGHFIFNFGLGVDYTLTGASLEAYSDDFRRVDFTGEAVTYRYLYSNFAEQHNQLRIVVPVQFAYRFGSWFYVGVGAAFRSTPIINRLSTTTQMLTEGEYDRFIQPIRNTDKYGYWPSAEYTGKGQMLSANHEIALDLELGVRVPLGGGVQMRAGVFAAYDLPVVSYAKKRETTPLVDYSQVDTNPKTQSQANLAANIRFNSLFDAPTVNQDVQRLRVGARLTFIINVTRTKKSCMCEND